MIKMKNSGIAWIGDIPSDWNVAPNKRVMQKSKIICDKYNNENVLSLTMNGVIVRDLENPTGKMPLTFDGYQYVQAGNLLMCLFDIDVTPRCVGVINNDGVTSPAYSQFKLLNDNYVRYYYYYYLYLDFTKELLHLAKNLRHSLTESQLGEIYVPVPPLETQYRIADYLDKKCAKIDAIIEKQQAVIEKLKEYKLSIITEAVTKGLNPDVDMLDSGLEWIGTIPSHWQIKKLKYATEIMRGKFNHRPRNDPRYYDGKYPFVQTGDVARATKYIASYSQTLNELGYSVSKEFPKGSICMTIAANVGDVAVLNFDACFPDSVVGFVPSKEVNWNYLFYVLKAMKKQLTRNAIISTQMNLNIEIIKEEYIPLAPLDEQISIMEFLDKKCNDIDKIICRKQDTIEKLTDYKKSLIYEVVTGKKEV